MKQRDGFPFTYTKEELRKQARRKRKQAFDLSGETSSLAIIRHFPEHLLHKTYKIAGYWPLGSELDPRPLMYDLAEKGILLSLPVIEESNLLSFRLWKKGDRLCRGRSGLSEPCPSANKVIPHLILTPLLAFDEKGQRLGQGGGYYDRTLAYLRARTQVVVTGIAFSGQYEDRIPSEPHDQPLDWVITEKGAHCFTEHDDDA